MADPAKGKLLGALLPHLAYEYGPQYVRDLWKQSKCKWDQFVEADKVNSFIERHVSIQLILCRHFKDLPKH